MIVNHLKKYFGNKHFLWWSAIMVFVIIRFLILVSVPTFIFDEEEMFNGTAALELLRGFHLPLQDYMYWPHEGGALVMSFLTAPFLGVFGPNFVAMKLSALLVSLTTFILWLRVTWRLGGLTSARYLAFLFCLAPPLILKSDLMIWGHHNNVCLFIAAATLFLTDYLSTDSPTQRRNLLIKIGIVCGFGLFFAYIFAPMLVTVLLTLAFIKIKERNQVFRFFLPSLAVGFLPWVLIRLSKAFPDGKSVFISRGAGFPGLGELLHKGFLLITLDLLYSPCFPDHRPFSFPVFSNIYFSLLALAAIAALFWAGRRIATKVSSAEAGGKRFPYPLRESVMVITGMYCLIFLASFCVSPFDLELYTENSRFNFITFRYLLPLYPSLFFLAAQAMNGKASEAKETRTKFLPFFQQTIIIFLIFLGVASVTNSIKLQDLGAGFAFNGYSYERFGWRMYDKYCRLQATTPLAFQVADRIDQRHLSDYYRGMGWGIAQFGFYPSDIDRSTDQYQVFLSLADRFPTAYRHFAYDGLGWLTMDINDNLNAAVTYGQVVVPHYRKYYYRGMGWVIGKRFFADPRQAIRYIESIPSLSLRAEAYYGLGRVLGENRAIGKHFTEVNGLIDTQWLSMVESGAVEVEHRYRQGRYKEGPVSGGGFIIGEYWD